MIQTMPHIVPIKNIRQLTHPIQDLTQSTCHRALPYKINGKRFIKKKKKEKKKEGNVYVKLISYNT
jgi:hypothetical protein